jgi:hypothetical protein
MKRCGYAYNMLTMRKKIGVILLRMTPQRIIQKTGFASLIPLATPILNLQNRADISSSKKISVLGCPPLYYRLKGRRFFIAKNMPLIKAKMEPSNFLS